MRIVGTVATAQKAEELIGKLKEKFPETEYKTEAGSSPGRTIVYLTTNVVKITEPVFEQMERFVNQNR